MLGKLRCIFCFVSCGVLDCGVVQFIVSTAHAQVDNKTEKKVS